MRRTYRRGAQDAAAEDPEELDVEGAAAGVGVLAGVVVLDESDVDELVVASLEDDDVADFEPEPPRLSVL